jgi:hypothetical protein
VKSADESVEYAPTDPTGAAHLPVGEAKFDDEAMQIVFI